MHRLFYLSASFGFVAASGLAQILHDARERNAAHGVTGLLLYDEGSFAQVIEGPEEAVRATFERISRDPRHLGCKVILDEPALERMFENCPMAFIPSAKMAPVLRDAFMTSQSKDAKELYDALHRHPIIRSFISGFDLAPRRSEMRETA